MRRAIKYGLGVVTPRRNPRAARRGRRQIRAGSEVLKTDGGQVVV